MRDTTTSAMDDMLAAADRLGFVIPEGHEDDYAELLCKTDDACELVLSLPDYKPVPDLERYPRSNVHWPTAGGPENPLRAWAWRADAGEPLSHISVGKVLSGKSVIFKDTVCMAGVPLLFGTDAFEGYVPDVDATVVSRVLENGGHILGKATCENFSHGASSSSSAYGPVDNPYATGFSAGGSSSGCGALIGSGAVDMGIGGDQGGSIRIPASNCGIVGLKPTFGLVPYTGVLTSDSGVDHVGPMARTVLDTAALLEAIAGYDNIDDRQLGAPAVADVPKYTQLVLSGRAAGVRGMKIGVLKEPFQSPNLAPSVDKVVRAAIEKFKDLGATVEEVSVPLSALTGSINLVVNKFASAGTRQGRQVGRRGLYLNDYWDQLLPWTQEKYDKAKYFVTGTAMSSEYGWVKYPTAYGRAMNLSRQMRDEFDALLETYDAIVMPTMPQIARRHIRPGSGPLEWSRNGPGTASFTGSFNLTGHPSMSIPVGTAPPMPEDILSPEDEKIKLPVGMMIIGKCWDEATVLRVGDTWEQQYDWKSL